MSRMISKLVISNSTKSAEVTSWDTITRQFLYTHRAMIDLPTGVVTETGSTRILGLTLKSTAIYELQNTRMLLDIAKDKYVNGKLVTYQ